MTLKDKNFQSSGLGEGIKLLQQKKKAEIEGTRASFPGPTKVCVRFTEQQLEILESVKRKVQDIAVDPRLIHTVTILRALIFLAETKRPAFIYDCMKMVKRNRPGVAKVVPSPLTIPLATEQRGKLEEQINRMHIFFKENSIARTMTNTMFFRAMLVAAEKQKPETIYRYIKEAVI